MNTTATFPKSKLPTWDEFYKFLVVDRKLSEHRSNIDPIKSRYKILCDFFKDKDFTRDTFNMFISEMKNKRYTNAYLNGFIKTANHLDKYLKTHHLQEYGYFKEKRSLTADILTAAEMRNLAEVYIPYVRRTDEINQRMRALIYLLSLTGCRISEALQLKWDDVYYNMVIFKDTKNGETRYVPITNDLYRLFNSLHKYSDRVFGIVDGSMINLDLKRRAKALGINKKVYNHLFRHSFITLMLQKGCPLTFLARIVGHKDWSVTNRYTHLVVDDLEKALITYHPLLRDLQTFEVVKEKTLEAVHSIVDRQRFSISVQETENTLTLRLVKSSSEYSDTL